MSVLARLRQRLARSPWIYWAVVAALAVVAAATVSRATSGIADARDAWGRPRRVVIATIDLAAGDPLAGAVRVASVPEPLVPPSALDADAPVDGAVARSPIAAGEMVVAVDVAAPGGPQALTPAGWLAVPVAERVPSGARVGDRVEVASGGIVLAADGVVVVADQGGGSVVVAVPATDAPMVAQAASGDAVLLLVP